MSIQLDFLFHKFNLKSFENAKKSVLKMIKRKGISNAYNENK